jgi:Na+-driven multidrug efflux pump
MNAILIMSAIYVIWLALGIWYAVCNLGNKRGKEPWYGTLLMVAVMPVAVLIGAITYLIDTFFKKD